MNSTTFRSHNENGRKQIDIERDATLWELVQRVFKMRSFSVPTTTTEVYERWTCCWLEKKSGMATTVEKANQLNAIMIETSYFEQLMENKP